MAKLADIKGTFPPQPSKEDSTKEDISKAPLIAKGILDNPRYRQSIRPFNNNEETVIAFARRFGQVITSAGITHLRHVRKTLLDYSLSLEVAEHLQEAVVGTDDRAKTISQLEDGTDWGTLTALEALYPATVESPIATIYHQLTTAISHDADIVTSVSRALTDGRTVAAALKDKAYSEEQVAHDIAFYRLPKEFIAAYAQQYKDDNRNVQNLRQHAEQVHRDGIRYQSRKAVGKSRNAKSRVHGAPSASSSASSSAAPSAAPSAKPSTTATSRAARSPPGPCKFCGDSHWNNECPQQPSQSKAGTSTTTSPAPQPSPTQSATSPTRAGPNVTLRSQHQHHSASPTSSPSGAFLATRLYGASADLPPESDDDSIELADEY